MDKHHVYRTITFTRLCKVLKVNPAGKKQHMVPNVCQNRPYGTQTQFQFSASTSPILSTMENATIARFMKKSMHLKTGFLLDYQVFLLASEWTTNRVCIDRFMTSESSDSLILPFTSKTGQSVAQNRQKIFLFGFYS